MLIMKLLYTRWKSERGARFLVWVIGLIFLEETANAELYRGILKQFIALLEIDETSSWFHQDAATCHIREQDWNFCENFLETGWFHMDCVSHGCQTSQCQICFYGKVSNVVYTTIILTAQRNWKQTLNVQFQTLITVLFIRWYTTWWNKWIPAFSREAANFNIVLYKLSVTKSDCILKWTPCTHREDFWTMKAVLHCALKCMILLPGQQKTNLKYNSHVLT